MTTCTILIREDLKNFKPYSSARKESGYADVLLNANERAWPNSLYPELYRYPDQQPQNSLNLLAKFYEVESKQILLSRGSDEAIELLIRLFCMPGKETIMTCPPTFGMYQVSAALQSIETIEIPLITEDFALDIDKILSTWKPSIKILFLCSPNNPTGNLISTSDIECLCDALKNKAIVVVDEAYIEYAREKSFSRFIKVYDNLVILRTLSKAFGLAGARCGIALSNPSIIENLLAVMAPYPIPSTLTEIIEKNMKKDMLMILQQSIEQTHFLRETLVKQLRAFSFIQEVRSTEANFILMKVDNPKDFLTYCESNSILLRDMSNKPGLMNTIRISIGNQNGINRLIDCARQYDE